MHGEMGVPELVQIMAPHMRRIRQLEDENRDLRRRLGEPQQQVAMDLLEFTAGTPIQLKAEGDGRWGVSIALGKHRTGVSGCKDAREAFVRGLEHIRHYYDRQEKDLQDCYGESE
jgi:hypothetical protein